MTGDSDVRLFLAIELPLTVKEELRRLSGHLKARCGGNDLKWVAADSVHLTLKFLGETSAERLDSVRAATERSCAGNGELLLSLHAVGAFPSASRPRVIWVGLDGDVQRLTALAAGLDRELGSLGFPRESRPFSPHLTLARVRPGVPLQALAGIGAAVSGARQPEGTPFTASEVSVMRSQLRPEGPLYTCLARFPLATRGT